MAESDLVALPDGALDDVAARVGASLHGSADGTGLRIGIACAEFNGGITLRLLDGALERPERGRDRPPGRHGGLGAGRLRAARWSPGPSPTPARWTPCCAWGPSSGATRATTTSWRGSAPSGIQQVQLATGVPVVFGVLTTDTLEQALVRSQPDETNKGREAALTGIEMVRLLRSGPLS